MSNSSPRFAPGLAPGLAPTLTALVMIGEQLDELFEAAEAGDPEAEPTGVLAVDAVQDGLVYEIEVWECCYEPTYARKLFGDKVAAVAYFNELFEGGSPSDRVRMRVLQAGTELLCGQFIEKEITGVRRYSRLPRVA